MTTCPEATESKAVQQPNTQQAKSDQSDRNRSSSGKMSTTNSSCKSTFTLNPNAAEFTPGNLQQPGGGVQQLATSFGMMPIHLQQNGTLMNSGLPATAALMNSGYPCVDWQRTAENCQNPEQVHVLHTNKLGQVYSSTVSHSIQNMQQLNIAGRGGGQIQVGMNNSGGVAGVGVNVNVNGAGVVAAGQGGKANAVVNGSAAAVNPGGGKVSTQGLGTYSLAPTNAAGAKSVVMDVRGVSTKLAERVSNNYQQELASASNSLGGRKAAGKDEKSQGKPSAAQSAADKKAGDGKKPSPWAQKAAQAATRAGAGESTSTNVAAKAAPKGNGTSTAAGQAAAGSSGAEVVLVPLNGSAGLDDIPESCSTFPGAGAEEEEEIAIDDVVPKTTEARVIRPASAAVQSAPAAGVPEAAVKSKEQEKPKPFINGAVLAPQTQQAQANGSAKAPQAGATPSTSSSSSSTDGKSAASGPPSAVVAADAADHPAAPPPDEWQEVKKPKKARASPDAKKPGLPWGASSSTGAAAPSSASTAAPTPAATGTGSSTPSAASTATTAKKLLPWGVKGAASPKRAEGESAAGPNSSASAGSPPGEAKAVLVKPSAPAVVKPATEPRTTSIAASGENSKTEHPPSAAGASSQNILSSKPAPWAKPEHVEAEKKRAAEKAAAAVLESSAAAAGNGKQASLKSPDAKDRQSTNNTVAPSMSELNTSSSPSSVEETSSSSAAAASSEGIKEDHKEVVSQSAIANSKKEAAGSGSAGAPAAEAGSGEETAKPAAGISWAARAAKAAPAVAPRNFNAAPRVLNDGANKAAQPTPASSSTAGRVVEEGKPASRDPHSAFTKGSKDRDSAGKAGAKGQSKGQSSKTKGQSASVHQQESFGEKGDGAASQEPGKDPGSTKGSSSKSAGSYQQAGRKSGSHTSTAGGKDKDRGLLAKEKGDGARSSSKENLKGVNSNSSSITAPSPSAEQSLPDLQKDFPTMGGDTAAAVVVRGAWGAKSSPELIKKIASQGAASAAAPPASGVAQGPPMKKSSTTAAASSASSGTTPGSAVKKVARPAAPASPSSDITEVSARRPAPVSNESQQDYIPGAEESEKVDAAAEVERIPEERPMDELKERGAEAGAPAVAEEDEKESSSPVAEEDVEGDMKEAQTAADNKDPDEPLLAKQPSTSLPSATSAASEEGASAASEDEKKAPSSESTDEKKPQESNRPLTFAQKMKLSKPAGGGFAMNSSFIKLSDWRNFMPAAEEETKKELEAKEELELQAKEAAAVEKAGADRKAAVENTKSPAAVSARGTPEEKKRVSRSPNSDDMLEDHDPRSRGTPESTDDSDCEKSTGNKYDPEVLKAAVKEPKPCPIEIPYYLKAGYRKTNAPPSDRVYALKFMKQFQNKANCLVLPPSVNLPAAISKDARVSSTAPGDTWARGQRLADPPRKSNKGGNPNNTGDQWQRGPAPPLLESGENSWKKQQAELRAALDKDAEIERKTKSILNKLTFEKFDKLYAELCQLGLYKYSQLEYLTREIFEKATTQHHFIEMYTMLCKKITNENPYAACLEEAAGGEEGPADFKRLLLTICQDLFEKEEEEIVAESKEEETELYFAYKKRRLGNVKFVGNLLINRLLTMKIIHRMTSDLVGAKTELSLEQVCVFLETIGCFVESQTEGKLPKNWEATFSELTFMAKEDKELGFRTRALIQDLLDLRQNGWVKNTTLMKEPLKAGKLDDVNKKMDEMDIAAEKAAKKKNSSAVVIEKDSEGFSMVKSGAGGGKRGSHALPKSQSSVSMSGRNSEPLQRAGSSFSNLAGGSRFAALEKEKKKKKKEEKEEPLKEKKKSRDGAFEGLEDSPPLSTKEEKQPKLSAEEATEHLAKAARVFHEEQNFAEIVEDFLSPSSFRVSRQNYKILWQSLLDSSLEKREAERNSHLRFLGELLLFWGKKHAGEILAEYFADEEKWEMIKEDNPLAGRWVKELVLGVDGVANMLEDGVKEMLEERGCM